MLAGAGAENFPPTLVATEGWPPNLAKATALLGPMGVVVVDDPGEPPLPFADGAFDLVISRHPATVHWSEIARVLTPAGTYFAQHVGGGANVEISEWFLGPLAPRRRPAPRGRGRRGPGGGPGGRPVPQRTAVAGVLRCRRVVWFLRKVIWTVPDFTVDRYRARLRELHDQIQRDGAFRSTTSRTLFEVRKPPAP